MAVELPATATKERHPRVFLSYSHDSKEHAGRVLALARELRRDGVDGRMDQFEAHPPEGWPLWCARQILDADQVVLICTATYRQRFLGYERPGTGRGVKWEGKILQNILYRDERNTRLLPVVFSREDERFIPETVAETTWTLLGDLGPNDSGFASLLQRLSGGRTLPPLPELPPTPDPSRPPDASVATGEVADDLAIQLGKLDDILAEQRKLRLEQEKLTAAQEKHEKRSWKRQLVIVAGLVALAIGLGVLTPWIVREIRLASAKTEAIITDPVVLRAKLEQKINQTFEKKRGELLAANAPPAEIDALYRWCDRAKGQVAEGVAFITARAGDVNSPIVRKATAVLEERGVDAALEFLDGTLKAERQRRKEEGRQLAEASMLKAYLHRSRFETDEEEHAVRDAIADAPDWWLPHNQLGLILNRRAEWKSAEQEYEAAAKTMGADEEAKAIVLCNVAALFQATNRSAEAEPLIERALKIHENKFGPEHPEVATMLNNLAEVYESMNRPAEAEPLLERALKIDEKRFGPENPHVALVLSNLAALYLATNRSAEAEPLLERALKIDEKNFGPENSELATPLNNLAQVYQATNRPAEAEPLLERALRIDEKNFGPEHPSVARVLGNLAALYQATNRPAEAAPLMERVLKINEKRFGPEHREVVITLGFLAELYQSTNRLAEAESMLRRAVVMKLKFTRAYGYFMPRLKDFIGNYKILLGKMSLSDADIAQRLATAGREAGYGDDEFAALIQELGE